MRAHTGSTIHPRTAVASVPRPKRRTGGVLGRSDARGLTPAERSLAALMSAALVYATLSPVIAPRVRLTPEDTRPIRVEAADTLWSIAQDHPVPGLDTARSVIMIRRMNGLRTSSLTAGMILRVPRSEGEGTPFASR